MKYIPLTQGEFAIVDDDDYEKLSEYKWFCHVPDKLKYALRQDKPIKGKRNLIRMHRVVLNAPTNLFVDHINGNGLDNRKENLRLCTHTENQRNSAPRKDGTSKYKGVCWKTRERKWSASIRVNKKKKEVGTFHSEIEAARAYNKAALFYFGEFARINEVN